MQYREEHPQGLAVVHVHCAPGILECLFCATMFGVRRGGWILVACERTSPRTGPDYKLSDKGEQGRLISESGHFSLAPCRAAESLSPFCISMMLCVLGQVRDTCLRVRKPVGLHQPAALNEHDWLWWGLRSRDNTGELFRLFVIRLSQVLQLIQYQHAGVLVFLHSTL